MKVKQPEQRNKIALVVPAAGRGQRMGGSVAKQYMKLGNKPVLIQTLEKFVSMACFQQIIIMVSPGEENTCRDVLESYIPLQFFAVFPGGQERQETVAKSLTELEDGIDMVCVHDAVRPLIKVDVISDVLHCAAQYGAAVAAVPVKDTIKEATSNGFVNKTLYRDKLQAIQTPQAFHREVIARAYKMAEEDGIIATDDASLVEKLPFPVKLVPGNYANLKITTPEDMIVARALYEAEGKEEGERRGGKLK